MKIPSREECDLFGVLSMNSEGNICIIRECAPASCNPVCDSKDPFFYTHLDVYKIQCRALATSSGSSKVVYEMGADMLSAEYPKKGSRYSPANMSFMLSVRAGMTGGMVSANG